MSFDTANVNGGPVAPEQRLAEVQQHVDLFFKASEVLLQLEDNPLEKSILSDEIRNYEQAKRASGLKPYMPEEDPDFSKLFAVIDQGNNHRDEVDGVIVLNKCATHGSGHVLVNERMPNFASHALQSQKQSAAKFQEGKSKWSEWQVRNQSQSNDDSTLLGLAQDFIHTITELPSNEDLEHFTVLSHIQGRGLLVRALLSLPENTAGIVKKLLLQLKDDPAGIASVLTKNRIVRRFARKNDLGTESDIYKLSTETKMWIDSAIEIYQEGVKTHNEAEELVPRVERRVSEILERNALVLLDRAQEEGPGQQLAIDALSAIGRKRHIPKDASERIVTWLDHYEAQKSRSRTMHKQSVEIDAINDQIRALQLPYTVKKSDVKESSGGTELTGDLVRGAIKFEQPLQWFAPDKDQAFLVAGAVVALYRQLGENDYKTVLDAFFSAAQTEVMLGARPNNRETLFLTMTSCMLIRNAKQFASSKNQLLSAVGGNVTAYLEDIKKYYAFDDSQTVELHDETVAEKADLPESAPLETVSREQESLPEVPDIPGQTVAKEIGAISMLLERLRQLEIRAFPPTTRSIDEMVVDLHDIELEKRKNYLIERERLVAMLKLAEGLDGQQGITSEVYRLMPGSLQEVFPYYVTIINHNGGKVVVAENPRYGNATYVFEELDPEYITWQQMIQLDKQSVRDLGGRPLRHGRGKSIDEHYERVGEEVLSRLLRYS